MVVNAPTSNIAQRRRARGRPAAGLRPQHRAGQRRAEERGSGSARKYTGVELADKIVGVVGLGRIGMLVAQRLSAFGVKLIAYDPYVQPARAAQMGVRMVALDELLAESRLHHRPPAQDPRDRRPDRRRGAAQGQADRAHHQRRPRRHRRRGRRSYDAIEDGRVAGAGLDVFAKEPCTDSPLFALEQRRRHPAPGRLAPTRRRRRPASPSRSRCGWRWPASSCPTRSTCRAASIAEDVRPVLAAGREARPRSPRALAGGAGRRRSTSRCSARSPSTT